MASLEADRLLANRYRLNARLGDGGHAEVWSARDTRDDRVVALKFLHLSASGTGEALAVLRHEAGMVHRLDHPGVLAVEEPLQDGSFAFLPMEYAPGGDASRLRSAPWHRIVPVLVQVARVLEHAHSRGVVHRDIKPGNVLFAADGSVRLSDFGTSARTGRADALSAGSPFSASPQQLRGEAAATADDIHGLGALAYELLTGYPPFYPRFDAGRAQAQEPPPPVPAHPAPAALLELVQAMLSRDPGARPDLGQVIERLDRYLETTDPLIDPSGIPAGEAIVVEPALPAISAQPAAAQPRRRGTALWWLGAVTAAAGAAFLWLPKPSPDAPAAVVAAPAEPVVRRVADAVVSDPAAPAGEESAPAAAPAAVASVEDELRAGRAALDALQPAVARAAFQRALALQADHPDATAGLAEAGRQESLLAELAAGTRQEAAGNLAGARERYAALLAKQPGFAPARAALSRVEQREADLRFDELLAAGAGALRQGQIEAAQSAYLRASQIRPGDPRVVEGGARLAEVLRDRKNAGDMAAGSELEKAERWEEALAHYRRVIERDASLRFAQDGLARSERRAALDAELADYLARPERLTAAAVRRAAEAALARGEATDGSPRLAEQLRQLRARLNAVAVNVRVALTSDNSTRVSVARVGDLGSFTLRELQLPPGQYTVIGRREGYRDVRYELSISPGQDIAALTVQCTERI